MLFSGITDRGIYNKNKNVNISRVGEKIVTVCDLPAERVLANTSETFMVAVGCVRDEDEWMRREVVVVVVLFR